MSVCVFVCMSVCSREQTKEFHSKRVKEAFSLMSDLLQSKPPVSVSRGTAKRRYPEAAQPTKSKSLGHRLNIKGRQRELALSSSSSSFSASQKHRLPRRGAQEVRRGLSRSATYTKPSAHAAGGGGGGIGEPVMRPLRKISSTEGLTNNEQQKMAEILVCR